MCHFEALFARPLGLEAAPGVQPRALAMTLCEMPGGGPLLLADGGSNTATLAHSLVALLASNSGA